MSIVHEPIEAEENTDDRLLTYAPLGISGIGVAFNIDRQPKLDAPDAVVNVTRGFKDRVKEITGGRGADVIFDPVGGDVFDESVRCIAFDGRILSIGFTSGRLPVLPVNYALIKGFSVMGVRAGEYGRKFPEKGRENNEAIWKLAAEGAMRSAANRRAMS